MKYRSCIRSRRHVRGFSLVAAVFVIVVLSAIGAFMVTIGEVQRQSPIAALQGARAYQAAQAGIEWGVFNALQPSPVCTASSFSPAVAGLQGFNVAVTCSATAYLEGASNYSVYVIGSRATYGTFGGLDFYSRNLQVTVTNASSP